MKSRLYRGQGSFDDQGPVLTLVPSGPPLLNKTGHQGWGQGFVGGELVREDRFGAGDAVGVRSDNYLILHQPQIGPPVSRLRATPAQGGRTPRDGAVGIEPMNDIPLGEQDLTTDLPR